MSSVLRFLFVASTLATLGAGCAKNLDRSAESADTHPVAPAAAPSAAPTIPQNAQNIPKPVGY
jgi:hypothetical protein